VRPFRPVLALLVVLAGCGGGDGQPGASPPPPAREIRAPTAGSTAPAAAATPAVGGVTAAPSPPPTAMAVPVPPPKTAPDAAGGIAFVRAYYAEVARALYTRDLSTVIDYSLTSCGCRGIVGQIRQLRAQGLRYGPVQIKVIEVRVLQRLPAYLRLVVDTESPPVAQLDDSGRVVNRSLLEKTREIVTMTYDRGRWTIDDVRGTVSQQPAESR
jgi:hypothetical protein